MKRTCVGPQQIVFRNLVKKKGKKIHRPAYPHMHQHTCHTAPALKRNTWKGAVAAIRVRGSSTESGDTRVKCQSCHSQRV